MYELCRLSTYKHLRAFGCLFVGLVFGVQVNAAPAVAPDAAFDRFMWTVTGANSQSVTVGTGGTPVASPTGSGTIAADGTKTLQYGRDASWRNASGNPVNGRIGAKILINPKTAKLLANGVKALPGVGTAYALWTMANDIGFDLDKAPDGEIIVSKQSSMATCNVTYVASPYSPTTEFIHTRYCVPSHSGSSIYNYGWSISWGGAGWPGVSFPCGNYTCKTGSGEYALGQTTNATNAPIPSSLQELEDAIATESGWPSTSSIPQAIVEAARLTGQKIPVESPTVTGPPTSPGTTSTTTTPTTTTTTNVTHNHTYNDNRVTNTLTRSSNVTNNTTGQTETTTTVEEPIEEPSECEKNPNSLNCSDLDTPEGEIPKVEKVISYQAEDLGFGGGSCPANVTMTPKGVAVPITVINWTDNCQKITSYAKPMILSMAIFTALMIIFVGGKPE